MLIRCLITEQTSMIGSQIQSMLTQLQGESSARLLGFRDGPMTGARQHVSVHVAFDLLSQLKLQS
jgi:hypothetical protein